MIELFGKAGRQVLEIDIDAWAVGAGWEQVDEREALENAAATGLARLGSEVTACLRQSYDEDIRQQVHHTWESQ